MKTIAGKVGPGFIKIGAVFLIIGFVQQGYRLTFENGFFSLGLIFLLAGGVSVLLNRDEDKK